MKVLIDTCVMSELRKPHPDPRVTRAVSGLAEGDLHLSVITVGELLKGIHRLPQGKKRASLEAWFAQIEAFYGSRILPIDAATARTWGEITARSASMGYSIPMADGLIAATAITHGMHIMTRNTPDFAVTGALIIDPCQ